MDGLSRDTRTPAPRGMRGQSCTRPAGNLTDPSLRFLLAAKMLTCKARASAAPEQAGPVILSFTSRLSYPPLSNSCLGGRTICPILTAGDNTAGIRSLSAGR
ncbi:hypothetical protein V8C26DRAFT_414316 [Trichoderma gracile]